MPTRITDLVLRSFKALATSGIYMLNLVLARFTTASETSSSWTVGPKAVLHNARVRCLVPFRLQDNVVAVHTHLLGIAPWQQQGYPRSCLPWSIDNNCVDIYTSINECIRCCLGYHFVCNGNDRGVLPNDTLETLLNVTNKEGGRLRSNLCNLGDSGHWSKKRKRDSSQCGKCGDTLYFRWMFLSPLHRDNLHHAFR